MDDIFLSAPVRDHVFICVSPLSRATLEQNGATGFGGDSGYFIYEMDNRAKTGGIHVLAKAVSPEAALRLVDIFLIARRAIQSPPETQRRRRAA